MTLTEDGDQVRTRNRRRWWRLLVPVLVAVLAGGGVVLAGQATEGRKTSATDTATVPTSTAAVSRRTLADRISVDGVLGYAGSSRLPNNASGVLTSAVPVGKVVIRGGELYRLDNRPVVLLYGRLPQWREFRLGMTKGPDIKQLELNLRALGFDPHKKMIIDSNFTTTTAAAVKRWQKSLGLSRTGVVGMGDFVFHPGPVRVAQHLASVGSKVAPGAAVLQVTGTGKVVTVQLDASRQTLVKTGTKVRVVLPSGRTVEGTVSSVGKVATKRGEDVTIDVTIRLPRTGSTGSLDQAPVEVLVSLRSKTALAVPVKALLALPTGGFAVEVVTGGQRHRVPVKTGMFADGYVAVSGAGIKEGVKVVVPQ